MVTRKDDNAAFAITVEYDKEAPNPENVFLGISKLISSFKAIDNQLIACVDTDTETELILEDVEKGSIKVWLRNQLKKIPDDALASGDYKKVIGHFLVEAKYFVIEKCSQNDSFPSVSNVTEIEDGIQEIAQNSEINMLNCYTKPDREQFLMSINMLGESFASFRSKDVLKMEKGNGQTLTVNTKFRLPMQTIDEFCAGETIENDVTDIVKVRKPDFLGETAWEFRYEDKGISAKISDDLWLNKYLSGHEVVLPGDSLKVNMHIISTYDGNKIWIKSKYEITKVLAVVHQPISIPLLEEKKPT